jgi:acetolactate decarboxylase
VIANTSPGYQTTRPHDELKVRFVSESEPVTVIGVYSTQHAGIFTHHGSSTHIHMVSADERRSGHVDAIYLGEHARAFVPKP